VRVEAERRLKALEKDLASGERANKERALATRYHKVKFFGAFCCVSYHRPQRVLKRGLLDRQKLLRKIRQVKRRLDDEEISSKVRKTLKAELFDLRVDLNYVMVRLISDAMLLALFTSYSILFF
jgi:hypothetical protein